MVNPCRLCALNSDDHTNIFSEIGIKLKMHHIINEHFKCNISEKDSLPHFVCQLCWSIIETFHALYEKAKTVEKKFYGSLTKIESDSSCDIWPENMEQMFDEDSQGVGLIKLEPAFEEDSLDACDDESVEINDETTHNGVTKNSSDLKYGNHKSNNGKPESVQTSDKIATSGQQKKKTDFEKLFSENKHRFDMTCDVCPKLFDTLEEAKHHYASDHDNPRGYIKCCNVKLIYRCKVVKHLYRHLDPDKFKCHECGKVYFALHVLKTHMKQHADNPDGEKEMVICDICKKAFTSKLYLRKHLQWHMENGNQSNQDEQYRKFIIENFDRSCDLCEAVFTTFHDAKRHYRDLHNEKKGYMKCCDMKLNEYWLVIDHINSHLNPKIFKCDLCDKIYADRKKFYLHKRRHKQAILMSFTCDYCAKHFRNKESIIRHMFTNHVKSKPKFECETCHKRFQLMSLLRNHYYSVHREKKNVKFTCEICGKSFNVKANFDKHMLLHVDKSERLAQRKQCEHCGEYLMTKSGLYYHDIIHTSGVQKCDQCQMELPHKLALLAHIRKHHREPKHRCDYCGKTFDIGSKLREHEESHTRHNIYPCDYCVKKFSVLSSRHTHMRRNHPDELKERKKMRKMLQLTPS